MLYTLTETLPAFATTTFNEVDGLNGFGPASFNSTGSRFKILTSSISWFEFTIITDSILKEPLQVAIWFKDLSLDSSTSFVILSLHYCR